MIIILYYFVQLFVYAACYKHYFYITLLFLFIIIHFTSAVFLSV